MRSGTDNGGEVQQMMCGLSDLSELLGRVKEGVIHADHYAVSLRDGLFADIQYSVLLPPSFGSGIGGKM